eukprot:RCo050473
MCADVICVRSPWGAQVLGKKRLGAKKCNRSWGTCRGRWPYQGTFSLPSSRFSPLLSPPLFHSTSMRALGVCCRFVWLVKLPDPSLSFVPLLASLTVPLVPLRVHPVFERRCGASQLVLLCFFSAAFLRVTHS